MPVQSTVPKQLRSTPFRASDAVGAGLVTRRQLQGPAWRRLYRDIYVSSDVPDTPRLRHDGAALLLPAGAVFTGRSAAILWGARFVTLDGPVEVLTQQRFGPITGLSIRTGPLAVEERATRSGLPVPSALHTTWELARTLPEVEAVEWIDALAHNRGLKLKALLEHTRQHAGEYAYRKAVDTLMRCDPRAESPPESRLRLHLTDADIPKPTPQYDVLVKGEFVARVDLAWPAIRFAIEYDGQWHVDPKQLGEDRVRLRELVAAGWQIYHVTREDMRDPMRLLRDITAAIKRRTREFVLAPEA